MERFTVLDEYRHHMDEGAIRVFEAWFNHRCDLSGFYYHLFSGDYESAACVASGKNLSGFAYLVRCLAQSAPQGGFGSPEKVSAWPGLMALRHPDVE
jgi:hypothetical protein